MNCQVCGYSLWNLRTRQCPECGEHFAPSQFEFTTNSVAFCCPHCDQAYYGTGENGHLVPHEFHCVKCSELVNMDLMVMRPAEGVQEAETQVDHVPWLAEKGWFKPFLRTVGMGLVLPQRLGKAMRPDQPVLKAWAFAAIVQALACFLMTSPILVFGVIMFFTSSGSSSAGVGAAAGALGFTAGYWLALMIIIGFWGALSHAILKMTGETPHSIGRTYECICYSSAGYLTAGVPCVGAYLGWFWGGIWWGISAMFMLIEAQRVSGWRAAVAGLVPPLLCMAVLIGSVGFLALGAFNSLNTAINTPPNTVSSVSTDVQTATRSLAGNLSTYALQQSPHHAAELIDAGFASPVMFIVNSSATSLDDVPLSDDGSVRLSDLASLAADEQAIVIAEASGVLPVDVVAHRLGDFVFTYHGIDMSPGNLDQQLWLVIASPDPDANTAESFEGILLVGKAWGQIDSVLEDRFSEELAAQNRIRAGHNLPPLPHPREVRHGRPATRAED